MQFLGAVTSIGEEAFFLCTSLNSINLPASLVNLGRAAFMDCWSLSTVSFPASLQQIPDYCFILCYGLTQVEFSEGQKTIGKQAFMGCPIADVTLPASLTALGEQAFANSYFSEYKLAEGDAALLVHEGVLYSADGKTLIDCPENKSGFYQLRPGTETIAPYAFSKSSLGDSIVVPASVIQIAVNAFAGDDSPGPELEEAYFLGGPPEIFVPEEEEDFAGLGLTPDNNYSLTFVYGSDQAEAWGAALSPDGTLAGFTVRELPSAATLPKIARQDGVTGEMAAYFRGSLELLLTAESSDLTGLRLHYMLLDTLEESWGEPTPDAGSVSVASGETLTISATTRIKVAPYRNGQLCGPMVQQTYFNLGEIAAAINVQGNLEYTTTPHAPWTIDTDRDYNNNPNVTMAVSSPEGTFARPSQLQTTVTGPGCLVFWWQSYAPFGNQQCAFLDNDTTVFSISGQSGWVKIRYKVPEGQHTLTWQSIRSTESFAHAELQIDDVAWYPGEDFDFLFRVEGESAWVTDYLGDDLLVTVPGQDGAGNRMAGLDQWAFSHNNTIQGIILPEITEGYSSGYEIPQNVFTCCPALTAVFFQGLPPAYWPRISPWTTAYYPVDKIAEWDHYFRGMSEYRQRWLPILYPLVSAPSIIRVNGEPEENPDCFAESVSVLLSSDEPETVVCYTTDGTVPTADSPQAIDPLELTNTTTLTARVFREVDGVLQPCSAFSRRTFVNPEDFNQAVGVDADIITFVTDGDIPWKIYNRKSSQGVETNDVVGTGPVFPGRRSTLYATFTLQVPGIFAYKEYDCYHDLPSICQLYDQDGQPVATEEIEERLDHNWYRYTMKLENGELLPPGTYTMVWSLEIPNNHAIPNYEIVERKHFWFLDDFSVGGITVPLTVQCEPQEGGRTFADGIEGSYFNKFIGQNVALRAEENANYIFREWLDGVCDKSRTITIKDPEVDGADANIYTACFDETAYIQVAAQPAEAGSVSGGGKYYALGAEVCLSAIPERGWRFDRWSDDDPQPGTDPIPAERSFICEAGDHNRTFTAEFVRCITVAGDIRHLNKDTGCNLGGGTVTGFGDHDVENPAVPTLITLTATPENDNYAFLGWDDNGNRVIDPEESTESERELALTWNDVKYFHTTALFAYTAPVIIDYARGSENLGQITITKGEEELQLEDFRGTGCTLPLGTALTLEATAHEDSRFRGWQKKNGPLYTANPLTIEVSEGNNTYCAVFARLVQVEVTLADGSPEGCSARVWLGGVEQELSSQQEAGAFLQLEAVCAEHYRARWGNINKNTINVSVSEDPTANIYQVTFVPTYTVNLASYPETCPGADLPFAAQTYDLGTVSQFGAYGNNYWRFLYWQDGVTDNNRVFDPAENGNYDFTAFFERYVRIECQAGCSNFEQYAGYNSFTGAGDIVVTDVPQEVTITAVPGAGCRFDRWTDAAADSLPDKTNPVRVFNISTANTLIQLKGNFLRTQLITVGAKPGTEAWGTIEGALDNALVDYGTEITFTATPNPNCQFVRWSDGVTNPTRRIMVRENATYLAEFASEAQVNIHIQAGQEGWGCQAGIVGPDGSLTASGIFPVGVWHTLEARPAANHRFVRWSDGQNSPSRDIRLTEQGFEITAIFAQTANLTLEFQTDPEGIAVPNWYCRWDGFDRAPGTYVIDVGTYTLRYYVHGNWAAPETEQITLTIGENKMLTRVFQLITDGTVTGYLNPSEIGGMWRIKDTEEWLDNNTTLTLGAGDYEVEFQPVAGWLTPADQTIVVMANRKTSFTGVYSAIVPGVELTFSPSEVSEAAGPSATIATLRRVALEGNPIDLRKSLTVHLSASEKNALILPANSITIPAGRSLTQFQIGVIDNAVQEDFLYDDEDNAIGRGRIVTLSGRVAMASHCNCNGKPTDGSGIEQTLEADLIIWDNDDSLALSVTASPSTLPERDALYPQVLTIARNEANPETEVLVELSAFITDKDGVSRLDGEDGNADDTEIEFWMDGARLQFKFDGDPSVSMVMIPAGQASIKIDILARNDGKVDGNQVVSVFAEAQGYTPGSGWLMVSDLSFPDYVISNVATPDAGTVLESGSTHSLQVSLSNNGNMDTPIGLSIPIAIYASRGNAASGQNLLLETLIEITEEQPLPKNETLDFTFAVPLGNLFPANNWRFGVIVNPQNTLREVSNLNNRTWSGPFAVDAGYVTQLDPLPTASILPSESLVLTGFVSKSLAAVIPVPNVPVEVYFIYGQFRRALQTSSDADGRFSVEFVPQPTEIGRIIAGSCYPGTQVNTAQQEFDVLGFKYTADGKRYLQWDLTVNTPEMYTITLQNPNSTRLTGIQGAMIYDTQEKVELEFLDLADTLDGLDSQQEVTFRVTATKPSPERAYEYMVLRFTSTEGAQLDIPVYLYAIPQFARLALDPISIDTTMQLGVARQVEVILSNEGAAETGPVTVTVPDLSWLTLPAGGNMPSIPPGESAVITIQLKGDENTALGAPLSGTIAVNAENVQHGIQLPFRFTAVSEDKGSLQVTAMDEYTFNAKEEEDRTNLKNATVTVKNPYTGAVLAIGNTGETGICLLENLPVGKCQVIVSADKHADNVQLVDIAPGDTVEIDAFLPYLAITYSWEMESTEIADEYELVLKTVYETNVPVPVVETIMTTIFIDMEPDSVRLINVTLINRGQIAAEGVWLNIVNTTDFTFESSQLDGITLAPQQSLTVPVVVRRGDGSASDCYTEVVTSYYYECGMDRRWHRFSKQITLLRCPKTTYNPTNSGAGSWWPGFDGLYGPLNPSNPASYNGPGLMTPSVPPLPYVPTGCIPCQNGLINAAIKCGIGFIPIAGCASGIMDAIGTIYESYKQGQANWKDIIVDGTLAGLGCFADETIGKVSDILSCIVGFMDACDGLEGYPPVPYPSPGGYTPDTGGGTRSDLTRAGDASWMEALQKKMYWGYRQGADHWAIIEEFYGEREWMNCDAPQLNAFNKAFGELSKATPVGIPVVPENAPELLAVLPTNLNSAHLAAFVARWNRTQAYWGTLSGGAGALLPGGTDGNGETIINLQLMRGITEDMELCEREAQKLGYTSVSALIIAVYAEAAEHANTSSSVCATISLEIKQKVTMTREAFEGTLTMSNGHETLPIEQIGLALQVTDANNNDCTHLFEIYPVADKFNGISALDGNGELAAKATGSAVVRFIPERGAAPEVPVAYNFGGTLTYKNPFSGLVAVIELTPVTMTVNPSPSLQVHYFLQRDILGDDSLTPDIIEPSYPAELSALVYNNGWGEAKNFRIDSGQPQIIDNEKGLFIDFALWDYETEQSMLNGLPNNMPLGQVDLGNIAPKSSGLAQWWLTSSLLGHFVGMEASYSHLSSNGNPDLSLIESVSIHELIRSGHTLDGKQVIFLVNDVVDVDDVPDTLWFAADASSQPVLSENHDISTQPTLNTLGHPATYEFGITVGLAGWHYIRFADPGNGRYEIVKTERDGTELPFRNCWLTDRTLPDGHDPIYEDILHLLDYLEPGTYSYVVTVAKLPAEAVEVTDFEASSSNNEDVKEYVVTGDVDAITVRFNVPIDPATFTSEDLVLRRQGVAVGADELAQKIIIEPVAGDAENLTYVMSGFGTITDQDGFYALTVQCAGIADLEGYFGKAGKRLIWLRKHDFAGGPWPPPSLLSLARIIPEAGMDGEFDIKLTFLGNVNPDSITLAGFHLTRNGEDWDLDDTKLSIVSSEEPGVFLLKGLTTPDDAVNVYSLRFDAATVEDLQGNTGVGICSVSWGTDAIPPEPATGLAILPDHGESETDNITCLLEGETLRLSVTVAEVPLTLYVYTRMEGTDEFTERLIIALDADSELTQILPLKEITEGGIYTVRVKLVDPAGNSTESDFQFELDTTPLAVDFSALPDDPADADELLITFNAPFVFAADITLADILTVTYNGQQVADTTLEKVSATEYRLSGLKAVALDTLDDGDFALTLDLSQVSKLRSGLPGQGTADVTWQFQFDRIARFVWYPGWNILQLNFSKLTTATENMLQAMPRMLYDAEQKTFVRPQEQETIELAVPLWIFCADVANMTEPSGIWQNAGSSLEDIPNKSWVVFSPYSQIELEDNDVIAWELINGKYVYKEIMLPGHVYWIFSNRE